MSKPVKTITPSPCTGKVVSTQEALIKNFNAALAKKSGKDEFLGYVGGKIGGNSGQVVLGLTKDRSHFYAGSNGFRLQLEAKDLNEAIVEIHKDMSKGIIKENTLFPIDVTCLKPVKVNVAKPVAEAKVGRLFTVTNKNWYGFMDVPNTKDGKALPGKPAYFVSLFKSSDKYALGLGNDKAVVINVKLNASDDEIRKGVYNALNYGAGTDFRNPTVKRYTPEEALKIKDANDAAAKAVADKAADAKTNKK